MNRQIERETELVIYVGTRKLVILEGYADASDCKIIRWGKLVNPEGFENGLVTNLERASASLQSLINTLQPSSAGENISCFVVLGNSKLKTYSFSSSQYYQGMQRTISPHEIRSIVDQTRSVATLPLSEFVLQAIPESFLVNDTTGIRNPLGLEAHRLSVNLKIFTMNFQDFKNISKAFESAEIDVKGYFPKTLTLPEAVLSETEREETAMIADISDDSTQLILWKNGFLVDTRMLSAGSRTLTSQIAAQCGIDMHDAEKVKEQYASLTFNSNFGDELIPLIERNGKGKNPIHRQEFQEKFLEQAKVWLAGILSEIDSFAREGKVKHPHYLFTGGGAGLDGFLEFLSRHFSCDARIGSVRKLEAPTELLLDPSMTPALGMYRWLAANASDQKRLLTPGGFLEKTFASARDWFASYF